MRLAQVTTLVLLVTLPTAMGRLPEPMADVFSDAFGSCEGIACPLDGPAGGRRGVTAHYQAPPTNGWDATGANAALPRVALSADIGHNEGSSFTWTFELSPPELDVAALEGQSTAAYVVRFEYLVSAEPKDVLTLRLTRVLPLLGASGVTCLTAPGSTDVPTWRTFNAVPDPSNQCSVLVPGTYVAEFAFTKDESLSAGMDAAAIDELRIVRIGDDVCVASLGAACHDAAGL